MCETPSGSAPIDLPEEHQEPNEASRGSKTIGSRLLGFLHANEFLVLVVLVILLAKAYPDLGARHVQPQITATWIAVIYIFVMAGLGLKTEEFASAFGRVYFNAFVQVFNFGVISSVVFGFSRLMMEAGAISRDLADGMAICGCLPITVNMCVVLTKSAHGDEAAAIFNTAFSNMTGIFLSPALILGYLGVSGDVSIGTTFYQLAVRVLAPLVLGQVLRLTSKDLVSFVAKYKPYVARSQEYALVFIIYTVFCQTFSEKRDSSLVSIIWVILFQFILLSTFMTVAWFMLRGMFPDEPELRVMGLFGCTQKTIAIGVPLIKSIYDGDSRLGLYTLPLLIWYPMQMVIGSALAPKLRAFVASEKKRLADAAVVVAADDDNDGEPISTRDAHQVDEEEVEVSLPVTTLDQAPVEVDEERPVSDNPFFSSSS